MQKTVINRCTFKPSYAIRASDQVLQARPWRRLDCPERSERQLQTHQCTAHEHIPAISQSCSATETPFTSNLRKWKSTPIVGLWTSLKLFVMVLHSGIYTGVLMNDMQPLCLTPPRLLEPYTFSTVLEGHATHRLMMDVLPVAGSPTTITFKTISPDPDMVQGAVAVNRCGVRAERSLETERGIDGAA